MTKRMLTRRSVAFTFLALLSGLAVADSSLSRLRSLEDAHRYKEAFTLAQSLSPTYAGITSFDFLYANAALNVNMPGEAVFAYDRILMEDPKNTNALFGRGKAKYALKRVIPAKRDFSTLLASNPDYQTRAEAMAYLAKTNAMIRRARTQTIAFVRIVGGYDDDTNAAPVIPSVLIPPVTVLRLRPHQRAVPSWFNDVAAGLAINHIIDKNHNFFADVSGIKRINYNNDARQFESGIFRASAGFLIKHGMWRFRTPFDIQMLAIGRGVFQDTISQGLSINRRFGNHILGVLVQPQFFYFPHCQVGQCRTGQIGYGALDWLYTSKTIPYSLSARLFGARGSSLDPLTNFLVSNYWGGNLVLTWNGFLRLKPYISMLYQASDYQGFNRTFRKFRDDEFFNFVVAAPYNLRRNWFLTPSYSYSHNTSEIAINRYSRNLYQLSLEYRMV